MQKLLSRKYCYILLAVLWILTPTAYALSVTSQTPAANALDQNGNTDITVVFDDAVGNASTNNFVVNGSLSGLISGSIGGSTNITFDPTNDFKPGETVTVTLTTGLQGTSNVPLTAAKTSQFIVKAGGGGIFTDSGQSLGSSDSYGISLGDLDDDGDLDAVVANWNQGNKIWQNDGSGIFTDSGQSLGSSVSYGISLGDVDGDGDLDAVITNSYQGIHIWQNDGSGIFSDKVQFGNSNNLGMSLGDVDGDGDLDVVIANNNQGNQVWLNNGSGTFNDSSQSLGSSATGGVSLGDVDNDGDLDAMFANRSEANKLWLNNGSGTFTDSGQSLGSSDSYEIALGDIDNDGDLDAVIANRNEANKVWLNDGSGIFTDSGQSLGSYESQGVLLGDMDGDGDLDIVVSNNAEANRVWLNNGSGIFADSGQNLGSSVSLGLSLGDVDNNGGLDIVVANKSEANLVWLNNATANTDPILDAIGTPKTVTVGKLLTFTVTASDADGDTLTFSLDPNNVPPGATIDPISGVFNWTPSSIGNFSTTVKVTDDAVPNKNDTQIIYITVVANNAPVLNSIPTPQTVTAGSPLTFTATATDSDGDTLSFSLENAPTGATINSSSGVFSWTPSSAGSFSVTVKVTDDGVPNQNATQTISITVVAANNAPVLNSIPTPQTVTAGSPLTFTASATDSDGDNLSFSLENAPTGATINSSSGVFSWTPSSAGSFSVTVKVTDDGSPSQYDTQTVNIIVNALPINNAPVLNAITSPQTVTVGQTLTFTATATDSDGDNLSFSLENEPSGATIDASTGVFSWTPSSTGTFDFTVKVTDDGTSTNLSDQQSLSITVNPLPQVPVQQTEDPEKDKVDLTISQTDSLDPVTPESELTYSLTIINSGTALANNITVEDTLPAEVEFISATGTDWDCQQENTKVTCTLASLTGGGSSTIDIKVKVLATARGQLTNNVQVSSGNVDANPNNNNSVENTRVGDVISLITDVIPTSGGSITVDPEQKQYNLDDIITLTAIANSECYEFSHWEGACDGSGTECQLVMDETKETIAHFKPKKINLEIKAENGEVQIEPAQTEYFCDDKLKLTAIPDSNYSFTGWTGDITGKQETIPLILKEDVNIEAIFALSGDLSIQPLQVYPKPEQKIQFTASSLNLSRNGGNYIWAASVGEIVANADGKSATYTVPKEEGVYYVWVTDGNSFAWSLVDSSRAKEAIVLIRMQPNTLNLSVEDIQAVSVEAVKANSKEIDVTKETQFKSEDSTIAEVNQKGQVTALAVGETKILATYQNKTAEISVNVTAQTRVLQVIPDILVLYEDSTESVIINSVTKSGAKTVIKDVKLTIRDSNIASVNNGIVTDLQKGSTWLDANTGKDVLQVPVVVRSRAKLNITPSYATTELGKPTYFAITGGKPPYQITASQGVIQSVGKDRFIYRSQVAGVDAVLTVTDNLNNSSTANVHIVGELIITPKQAKLASGEVVTLRAIGGEGNYFWTATNGDLSSNTGSSVEYTAPTLAGLYTVTVRDGLENSQEMLILVGADLLLSQQELFLTPTEEVEISVLGGVAPYTLEVNAGKAHLRSDVIHYTAPEVAGNYNITIRDAENNEVNAKVKVALDLLITPSSGRIDAGETLTLHAAGGFGNKRWVSLKGSLDKFEGDSVTWTAPDNFGPAFVYVIDDAGSTVAATLEVSSKGFAVTPSVRHIIPGKSDEFTAVGGASPYTWTVKQGDYQEETDSISYTAPEVRGVYKINVQDNTGKKAQAQVNVFSERIFASPKTLYITGGETLPITIGGGTGTYIIYPLLGTVKDNQLNLSGTNRSVKTTYTAPDNYEGQAIIKILDSGDNLTNIEVQITAKEKTEPEKIIDLYRNSDGVIDTKQMGKAIDDFFAGQAWLDRTIMFEIAEQFVGE